MTDVYANIQAGKYENTVAYPHANGRFVTDLDYQKERKAYNDETRRIDEEFYTDCCDELGIDPKAASSEKLFSKAYDDGHAHGHAEIYSHLVDLDAFVNEWFEMRRYENGYAAKA